jgi:hypothetical protein
MKKTCIIIPAYNEAGHIASVLSGIRACTDSDILVIDDGSTDSTAAKAQGAGAIVIRHPFNMGYGVALQTGYKYAVKKHYELLVQMDGDGQHRAEDIKELCKPVWAGHCDIAIGSRFLSSAHYRLGILKSLGRRLFCTLIRIFTGERMSDPTSGYQCMNRDVFTYFAADSFPWDYPDANVIIMLDRAGFRIKEVPVTMRRNVEGRAMHRGLFTIGYYLCTVLLSILVTVIGKNGVADRSEGGSR